MENNWRPLDLAYTEALYSLFDEIIELDLSAHQAKILSSRFSPGEQGQSFPMEELWFRRMMLVYPADRPLLESLATWLRQDDQAKILQKAGLHIEFRMYQEEKQAYCWFSSHFLQHRPGMLLLCYLNIQQAASKEIEACQPKKEILDSLPVGVVLYEFIPQPQPIFISEKVSELLGYSPVEFLEIDPLRDLPAQLLPQGKEIPLSGVEHFETIHSASCKDGRPIVLRINGVFLRDSQGRQLCSTVIADATAAFQKEQQLYWQAEHYRILSESAEFITFDYQVEQDLMCININLPAYGPKEIREEQYLKQRRYQKHVLPGSWEDFRRALKAVCSGASQTQVELQIGPPGKERWNRAYFSAQMDAENRVYRVTGRIENIQEERDTLSQLQELRQKAEIDQNTGLLNKTAAENAVECYLQESLRSRDCALLVLDIDDFKQVNDKLGHLQGDALLRQCGQSLKASFREKDILGRIGGDEFIIFLKELPSVELAKEKARQALQAISRISLPGQPPIHCSLGLTMVPPQAREYRQIFQEADQALYAAKKQGKNSFVLYEAGQSR